METIAYVPKGRGPSGSCWWEKFYQPFFFPCLNFQGRKNYVIDTKDDDDGEDEDNDNHTNVTFIMCQTPLEVAWLLNYDIHSLAIIDSQFTKEGIAAQRLGSLPKIRG